MILRVVENNGELSVIKYCTIDEAVELLKQHNELVVLDDFKRRGYIKLIYRLCKALHRHNVDVIYMLRRRYTLVFTLQCGKKKCGKKIFVKRILKRWRRRWNGLPIVQLWRKHTLNLLHAMSLFYVYWLGMNPHHTHLMLGRAKHLLKMWFNITPEWKVKKTIKKTRVIFFLITPHQLVMLRKLAEEKGTTVSKLVKQAIQQLLERYKYGPSAT